MASSFGSIDKLPSGRYRARYVGPDRKRHSAPLTFVTKQQARAWLTMQHSKIIEATWKPPPQQRKAVPTLADYARTWLAQRDLKPRTRQHYSYLLDAHILPTLGQMPINAITVADVRAWHAGLDRDTPTMRAHAYSVLRTLMGSAVADGLAQTQPCLIRGAGNTRRAITIRPASVTEINAIAEAMPQRLRLLVLLSAWCALRYGEVTELRRRDVDLSREVIRVRRAVVRVDGAMVVSTPKSTAGVRDVAIPPHLLPTIEEHLERFTGREPDALLFANAHGGHLGRSSFGKHFYRARKAAGRDDLRAHDLRHTGATLTAMTGATLAELMGRLGHASPRMALHYQHVVSGRDHEIASLLSKFVDDQ